MEQQYADALAFCNRIREHLRRKPVVALRKGARNLATGCVLANTINHGGRRRVEVTSLDVTLWHDDAGPDRLIALNPDPIADFVCAFDRGEMPELIGSGWAA